jgi:hypothetical protein
MVFLEQNRLIVPVDWQNYFHNLSVGPIATFLLFPLNPRQRHSQPYQTHFFYEPSSKWFILVRATWYTAVGLGWHDCSPAAAR